MSILQLLWVFFKTTIKNIIHTIIISIILYPYLNFNNSRNIPNQEFIDVINVSCKLLMTSHGISTTKYIYSKINKTEQRLDIMLKIRGRQIFFIDGRIIVGCV